MSKAGLTYFIMDIKQLPDGDVRVLELGELYNGDRRYCAGLSGMHPTTLAAELWVQETVYGHTQKQLGLPVYGLKTFGYPARTSVDEQLGFMQADFSKPFNPEDLGTYDCVLIHAHKLSKAQTHYLDETLQGRVLVTNQQSLCLDSYANKGFFYAMARDTVPDLLPKQHLYAIADGKVDAARILDDFAGHSHIVLKQLGGFMGMGVDIRPVDQLTRGYKEPQQGQMQALRVTFPMDTEDLLIAQEVIRGKQVIAKNQAGKEGVYDPVIRVIATAWHSNGQTRIKCHDAYYKFPPVPVGVSNARKTLVSDVHGKGPRSGSVTGDDKAEIFNRLESQLPPLFNRLLTENPARVSLDLMRDADPAIRSLGLNAAMEIETATLEHPDSPVSFEEMRDAIENSLPTRINSFREATALAMASCTYGSGVAFSVMEESVARELEKVRGIGGKLRLAKNTCQDFLNLGKRALMNKSRFFFTISAGAAMNSLVVFTMLHNDRVYNTQKFETLFDDAGVGAPQQERTSGTTFHSLEVTADYNLGRTQQLEAAAENRGLSLCIKAEPLSDAQSTSLLERFYQANTQMHFFGVRLNETFHVFASDCPEDSLSMLAPLPSGEWDQVPDR